MFETNSSSNHCLVICSQEDWEKFMHAALFVEMGEYKGDCRHALITVDRICEQIKQSFAEDNIRFHSERQIPPHLVEDIRHFCIWAGDLPLPAVECRAIWYA